MPDPLMEVLLAQLVQNGTLSRQDLATMKRRLIEGGTPDVAVAIDAAVLSDAIDTPAMRRATLHSIDGGNGAN